jgi:hypothetical protein
MSVLAANYSRYLQTHFNFATKLNSLKIIFDGCYDMLVNEKFFDDAIFKSLSEYPKYQNNMMIVDSKGKFNFLKIYGITPDVPSYLIPEINTEGAKVLKTKLDRIPLKISHITNDSNFQFTSLNTTEEVFGYISSFYSFRYEKNLRNFFQDIFTEYGFEANNIKTTSGIYLYFLHTFFKLVASSGVQIAIPMVRYLDSTKALSSDVISNDFNNFIDSNLNTMSRDLFRIVVKCLYKFSGSSASFKDSLAPMINDDVAELKNVFNKYITRRSSKSIFEISRILDESIYNIIACHLIGSKFPNKQYPLSQDPQLFPYLNYENNPMTDLIYYEDTAYYNFNDKASSEIYLRDYMDVLYQYKEHPEKFINVILPTMRAYIDDYVKPESESMIPYYELISILQTAFDRNMNHEYLKSWLDEVINIVFIKSIINHYKPQKFAFSYHFSKMFDEFFATADFKKYVQNILEKIFRVLRDNGHANFNFSWFDYEPFIYCYFKALMRKSLLEETILTQSYSNINDALTHVLDTSSPPQFKTRTMEITATNLISANSMNIYRFVENLMNSTLTRETGYKIMQVFMA